MLGPVFKGVAKAAGEVVESATEVSMASQNIAMDAARKQPPSKKDVLTLVANGINIAAIASIAGMAPYIVEEILKEAEKDVE